MADDDGPEVIPPSNGRRFGGGGFDELRGAMQAQAMLQQFFEQLGQALDKIDEGVEAANGLSDVLEDVGVAYLDAEEHGEDPIAAGMAALEPRGEDDGCDELRVGLRFIVEACSSQTTVPRRVASGPPRERARKKKGRRR